MRCAITDGHMWALDWEYANAGIKHTTDRDVVTRVVDILDMFRFTEEAMRKVSPQELANVESWRLQFRGFDGNDETEYMGVAQFLIEDMGRWMEFKGRLLNSHSESVSGHMAMLRVFTPIRAQLDGRGLNAEELRAIAFADR